MLVVAIAALGAQCIGEPSTDGDGLKVEVECDSWSGVRVRVALTGHEDFLSRPRAAQPHPRPPGTHLYIQQSLISAYISGGHSGGHSILLPCLMKSRTSGPFIFCSGREQRHRCEEPASTPHAGPPPSPPRPICPAYLVGLLAVGEGLPHGDPVAPDIAAAGELPEVDALWRVPLQRPLPCRTGLRRGGAARIGALPHQPPPPGHHWGGTHRVIAVISTQCFGQAKVTDLGVMPIDQ